MYWWYSSKYGTIESFTFSSRSKQPPRAVLPRAAGALRLTNMRRPVFIKWESPVLMLIRPHRYGGSITLVQNYLNQWSQAHSSVGARQPTPERSRANKRWGEGRGGREGGGQTILKRRDLALYVFCKITVMRVKPFDFICFMTTLGPDLMWLQELKWHHNANVLPFLMEQEKKYSVVPVANWLGN